MNAEANPNRFDWPRVIRLGSLVVLVAILVTLFPVFIDLTVWGVVYENQGITDLGRDLLGVAAIERGGVPYQQIGDLIEQYGDPDLPLSGSPRLSGWIVHPPLALAGARALQAVFGSLSELVARRIGILGVVILTGAVIMILRRRTPTWMMPVAIATLVWVPTFTDTVWIQGNAFAGLGLCAVVFLDRNGQRTAARVVLGLLVAWKPWLAVFALALPRSTSVLKDVAVVGGSAMLATLAVLPFVGGFDTLLAWITKALPGNTAEARDTPSNLSWTSPAGAGVATLLYLGTALAVALARRRLPRRLWLLLPVWLATSVAPFVWDHYWLALAPIVWLLVSEDGSNLRIPAFIWLGLAVLPMLFAGLGQPGLENRVVPMVLAGASLFVGLVVSVWSVGRYRGPEKIDAGSG
ncbi:MAG: hypothetical protein ACXW1Y_00240 [Acidimicrobiia bacterium]